MGDRTVHASWGQEELARYDRAGKWYVETRGGGPRRMVKLHEAAMTALSWRNSNRGIIFYGRLGGTAFDSQVRKLDKHQRLPRELTRLSY